MSTQNRRTEKVLTPAQKEERLAEHRASKSAIGEARGLSIRSRIGGRLAAQLEREFGTEGQQARPKRRRGGRGRKQVAA